MIFLLVYRDGFEVTVFFFLIFETEKDMMGTSGSMQWGLRLKGKILVGLVVASLVVAAESRLLQQEDSTHNKTQTHNSTQAHNATQTHHTAQTHNTTQNLVHPHQGNKSRSDYKHVWPVSSILHWLLEHLLLGCSEKVGKNGIMSLSKALSFNCLLV